MLYYTGDVTGVTHLDNIFYVVCAGSSVIYLYYTDTFTPVDRVLIEVDGMHDPTDIVACLDDHQLYVADWNRGSPCIWRTSADSGTSTKWLPTAAIDHVETLSVTSRRLLMTYPRGLRQFSTVDERLLRVVRLPDTMQLCHGVETARETFVVGYRTSLWHYGVSK